MRLLYISYWSIYEPLTMSTIFPYLEIIKDLKLFDQIIFVTVERGEESNNNDVTSYLNNLQIIEHFPINSFNLKVSILTKIIDFVRIPYLLRKVASEHSCDITIARSSLAGVLGMNVAKKLNIPFIVESFEPHADYMADSGVWKRGGIKFLLQKRWERRIIKRANHIITVSNNFRHFLIEKYRCRHDNISTIPCCTDMEKFKFDNHHRWNVRNELEIPQDATCAIYVGKFGDIYYDQEAFQIFSVAFSRFQSDFYMIILTPHKKEEIEARLIEFGIDRDKVQILYVSHYDVPKYLSAADFAFSTIRHGESKKYCSPVKNGEYWANGLPIFLSNGVGDDYKIINHEGGGVLFDLDYVSINESMNELELLLKSKEIRFEVRKIAKLHRSFALAREVYSRVLRQLINN